MNKYLFVLDYNFRAVNLVSQLFEAIFCKLIQKGHQVTLLLPIEPSEPFLSGFKKAGVEIALCSNWRSIPNDAHSKKHIYPIARLCTKMEKKEHFDFISFHFCDPLMGALSGLMIRAPFLCKSAKLVFHQHNEVLTMEERLGRVPFFKRFFSKLGLLSFLVDRIICVYSRGAENLVTKGIPERCAGFIYNGLTVPKATFDRERIRQKLELGKSTVTGLYVGRLIDGKGVDIIIKALGKIARERECRLLIAGEGPAHEKLKELAKNNCPENSVTFLGFRKDIPDLMEAADFLLLPSRTEALPSVLIEAGHHGLPAIASTVGGIPEMIRHDETGLLVDSFDVSAWETEIRKLVEYPENLKNYRGKCRSFTQDQFSLSKTLSQYLSLYHSDDA